VIQRVGRSDSVNRSAGYPPERLMAASHFSVGRRKQLVIQSLA
jgi:hypothetical protein